MIQSPGVHETEDVPNAYSLGGSCMLPEVGFGEEVEGKDAGGREGMRITVLIWIWVEDV